MHPFSVAFTSSRTLDELMVLQRALGPHVHGAPAMHAYRPEEVELSHDVQQAPRAGWIERIRRAVFRTIATTA